MTARNLAMTAVAIAIVVAFGVVFATRESDEPRRAEVLPARATPRPTVSVPPQASRPGAAASATPAVTAQGPAATPSASPDRRSCGEIRGTEYRSDTERSWYIANCAQTQAAPSGAGEAGGGAAVGGAAGGGQAQAAPPLPTPTPRPICVLAPPSFDPTFYIGSTFTIVSTVLCESLPVANLEMRFTLAALFQGQLLTATCGSRTDAAGRATCSISIVRSESGFRAEACVVYRGQSYCASQVYRQ